MSPSVNARLGPSFTLSVQQGANPVIACTVYDRAGNVVDLTGFTLKLAAKRIIRQSNGLGKMVNKEVIIFDITAAIVSATLGNVTFTIPAQYIGVPGIFSASLRLWNSGTTTRAPDDAYAGSFVVEDGVVRAET